MYKTSNNIIVPTQFTKDYVYKVMKKDYCYISISYSYNRLAML